LDRLAKHFHKQYQDNAPSTQICRNLLLLLIYLYNFDVIQNGLLFDLLNLMANNFRDVDIELALVILQNVGARLRSEDPSGLKEALGKLREKATLAMQNKSLQSVHTSQMSNSKNVPDSVEEFDPSGDQKKRIEFMIETILDLKNNKMKLVMDKDANQNVTRVKKLIINHLKEKGKFADNHLTITWTDLISAENKGKWWMVGSVWTPTSADLKSKTDSQSINLSNFDAQLLELARKHRMNTDVRRAIFCIIVGSEDFLDAFEKLIKLELKSKQDRDIVTVLLHCCMQEKRFNPYYAHLAMKLCSYNRNFQSTFKFAYWDRFKELETMQNIRALSNLASLLAHLFGGGCLSLSMLKVVEFEKLGAKGVVFFRLMFITLFTEYDPETVVAVFARISGLNKVDKLRDGINIFFTEALSTYHLLGSDSSSKQRWKQVKEMMKLAKNAMKPKELQMF
jgi:nucleolar MIF4G domain-containing protein 1